MAISRMQQPRQQYGLGSLVKKAVRGVKKIVKSPIGKAALIGGLGMYGMGAGPFSRMKGAGFLKGLMGAKTAAGPWTMRGVSPGSSGLWGALKRGAGSAWGWAKKNPGQAGFLGLAGAATALPFLMKGDEEEDVVEESWDQVPSSIANIRNQARNYYTDPASSTLSFMPGKQFVNRNFYAANGGRAGLMNGGEPGQEQIEQMLMAEYVKYKNQGGTLSFEEFVQAVMQASEQQPEGAGMEQPEAVAMAANGGRMGFKDGKSWWDNFKSGWGQVLSGETEAFLGGDQEKINEILTGQGWGIDLDPETIKTIIQMHQGGSDLETISSITETDSGTVENIIERLNMKADGGRIGAYAGGSMDEDEDEYAYNPQAAMRMYKRPGKQEGGIMGTEVADEMIDLGGQEKDYRETGGFVDLGGKERADDVPARLSKNEFVFTADAVRAAGGGDIDQGAEVMQNMMENLEAGGEISEESQGLEGAQAMYDQQQMLQSRIA